MNSSENIDCTNCEYFRRATHSMTSYRIQKISIKSEDTELIELTSYRSPEFNREELKLTCEETGKCIGKLLLDPEITTR